MRFTPRFLFVLAAILIIAQTGQAQLSLPVQHGSMRADGSFPVPGSHFLREKEEALKSYIASHPEAIRPSPMRKISTAFAVGDTKSWYAHDFTSGTEYLTASTCRAVGQHCYVFVEDGMWESRATQASVDSVAAAFDLRTPADPSRGVFQMDVDAFGNPPDVDGDSRIIILILDIRDGWSGTGGYVEGYFYGLNEIRDAPGSNSAEIYFLDAQPTCLNTAGGLQSAMSTTAHEFQHMIHWNQDPNEVTFINEGCSLAAEVNAGYPIYDQTGYVNETNRYLLGWRDNSDPGVLRDYSRAARFTTYIRDQCGMGAFKNIVASPLHGTAGLDAGLAASGSQLRFATLFPNWLVANILDDARVDPQYAYAYPDLPKVSEIQYTDPNVSLTSSVVHPLAAQYIAFKGGAQLRVMFKPTTGSLTIKAVEIGPSKRVVDVTPGVEFYEPEFGTSYSEIHFVVINADQSGDAAYTYAASGSHSGLVELRWDMANPVGYFNTSPMDTVCVTFDGIPGARLDSVSVALVRAGSISGGVWRFNTQTAPLGAPLAQPITASSAISPSYPFPVPWPGWSTIDLRPYAIDAGESFVVGFVCEGDVSLGERVMMTTYSSATPYHSYTYLHNPGPGLPPGWYYIQESAATIYIYMIHAYVSFPTTGTGGSQEILPAGFTLSQNYPNPFNPSTRISYTLPGEGAVRLTVFDVLGNEVARLVDGEQRAGSYQVDWNGTNSRGVQVPSGIYFYRLESGGLKKTEKMLLLK